MSSSHDAHGKKPQEELTKEEKLEGELNQIADDFIKELANNANHAMAHELDSLKTLLEIAQQKNIKKSTVDQKAMPYPKTSREYRGKELMISIIKSNKSRNENELKALFSSRGLEYPKDAPDVKSILAIEHIISKNKNYQEQQIINIFNSRKTFGEYPKHFLGQLSLYDAYMQTPALPEQNSTASESYFIPHENGVTAHSSTQERKNERRSTTPSDEKSTISVRERADSKAGSTFEASKSATYKPGLMLARYLFENSIKPNLTKLVEFKLTADERKALIEDVKDININFQRNTVVNQERKTGKGLKEQSIRVNEKKLKELAERMKFLPKPHEKEAILDFKKDTETFLAETQEKLKALGEMKKVLHGEIQQLETNVIELKHDKLMPITAKLKEMKSADNLSGAQQKEKKSLISQLATVEHEISQFTNKQGEITNKLTEIDLMTQRLNHQIKLNQEPREDIISQHKVLKAQIAADKKTLISYQELKEITPILLASLADPKKDEASKKLLIQFNRILHQISPGTNADPDSAKLQTLKPYLHPTEIDIINYLDKYLQNKFAPVNVEEKYSVHNKPSLSRESSHPSQLSRGKSQLNLGTTGSMDRQPTRRQLLKSMNDPANFSAEQKSFKADYEKGFDDQKNKKIKPANKDKMSRAYIFGVLHAERGLPKDWFKSYQSKQSDQQLESPSKSSKSKSQRNLNTQGSSPSRKGSTSSITTTLMTPSRMGGSPSRHLPHISEVPTRLLLPGEPSPEEDSPRDKRDFSTMPKNNQNAPKSTVAAPLDGAAAKYLSNSTESGPSNASDSSQQVDVNDKPTLPGIRKAW